MFTASKPEVDSSVEECFLCDLPVEVKFEPCGHAILCGTCSLRAKKCIKCKVKGIHNIFMDISKPSTCSILPMQAVVKSITKLNVICPMCNEEKATATMKPCGHKFCPGESFHVHVYIRTIH